MTAPPDRPPVSPARVLTLLAAFAFAGWLAGVVVAYVMPKQWESRALLDEPPLPDRTARIAPAHAAIAVYELDLPTRWGVGWDDAVRRVSEDCRLIGSPEGTWLVVRTSAAQDARAIASSLAATYHGVDAEAAWHAAPVPVDRDFEKAEDGRRLVSLLQQGMNEHGISPGNESLHHAREVAAVDADVARQLDALESLGTSSPFAPPGDPLRMPFALRIPPQVNDAPVSPDPKAVIGTGLWSGIIVGLITLVALARWKPAKLRPNPRPAPAPPEWAEERDAAAPGGDW